tara:strand:- start:620 stop:721 length:102 start_codon:yes stop_codon:yes gene_type:complete
MVFSRFYVVVLIGCCDRFFIIHRPMNKNSTTVE